MLSETSFVFEFSGRTTPAVLLVFLLGLPLVIAGGRVEDLTGTAT
jgi:hypothetical protein